MKYYTSYNYYERKFSKNGYHHLIALQKTIIPYVSQFALRLFFINHRLCTIFNIVCVTKLGLAKIGTFTTWLLGPWLEMNYQTFNVQCIFRYIVYISVLQLLRIALYNDNIVVPCILLISDSTFLNCP